MDRITRSDGLTPTERYLKRLCDRSFLTLWSYPNVFRDQGGGKEICDLLVVFDRHVIIFSDKSCAFPNTGDLRLDWSRWFRRSVRSSADQVLGAERWIRNHPDRVFLDRACQVPFPLAFPPPDQITFHRIVVALGAGARCREHFGSGSGSLMLSPLVDKVSEPGTAFPFLIGDLNPHGGYVHVLDDVTLDIVLSELDTISDFIAYLSAKEQLIRSERLLLAAGEEELLAYYLKQVGPDGRHAFPLPEQHEVISLDEGFWSDLRTAPQYLRKKQEDTDSYIWDHLIEAFNAHVTGGTLATGTDLGVQAQERGLRIMAGEPRLARRYLGQSILEKLQTTPPNRSSARRMLTAQRSDVAYVFVLLPVELTENYESYRTRRAAILEAYCLVTRYLHPRVHHVVGIASEPLGSNGGSEELAYLDASAWSEENERLARELHEAHRVFLTTHKREVVIQEYPDLPDGDDQRRARNKRKKAAQRTKNKRPAPPRRAGGSA